MRVVKLNDSEELSIVVEALINAPSMCKGDKVKCMYENKWTVERSNDNKKQIIFNTESWEPLNKYVSRKKLDYEKALQLTICLGHQLTALTKSGFGLLYITDEDITVIDDRWYLITNLSGVVPLHKENMLKIVRPITKIKMKPFFFAPEVKEISTLPAMIDQSCAFYSIACLCLFCLGLTDSKKDIYTLYPTPLYFLLMRCLNDKPDKRFFLLI